jgi:hydrogenase/urease accessory protein HupE
LDPRALQEDQWVVGFLSGVGWPQNKYDPLAGMVAGGVWGWVDNYCRAHPIETIGDAALAFVSFHPNKR